MMTRTGSRQGMAIMAIVVSIALSSTAALGERNPNPRVLPPNSTAFGQTYGEWGAAWWNWALSTPVEINPVLDTTGEFCSINQSGQVWFLAGSFGGGPVERQCTVPSGRALFFPIINGTFIADAGESEEEARQGIRAFIDTVSVVEASINGVPLTGLERYRAESPAYTQVLPEGAILDQLSGISGEFLAVADGFWLMLPSLPDGSHVIHFRGVMGDPADPVFEVEVTYNLTVRPGRAS